MFPISGSCFLCFHILMMASGLINKTYMNYRQIHFSVSGFLFWFMENIIFLLIKSFGLGVEKPALYASLLLVLRSSEASPLIHHSPSFLVCEMKAEQFPGSHGIQHRWHCDQSVAKVLTIVNVPLFTNAGFIHGVSNGKISFFLKAEYYSMVVCVYFIFSLSVICWWTFGYFHVSAFVNNAVMNVGVQITRCDPDFNSSEYLPRSGIGGLYGSSPFSFWKNIYAAFHNGCINLHSHQQCKTVPFLHALSSIYCL